MAVLALASCEKTVDALVKVDNNQLEFPVEGGTQTVSFTSTAKWEVKGLEKVGGWISVTPEEGNGSADKQELEIKVTPNEGGDRTAVITIESNVFAKKSIRINQAGNVVEAEQITVAEFLQKKDTETAYVLEGVISGLSNSSYKGFDLTDATGKVPCAFPANFDDKVSELANGCTVRIQGKYQYFEDKKLDQMYGGTILSVTSAPAYEITACTVAEFISNADATHQYRLSGTISNFNSQYCSFNLTDDSESILVYSVTDASKTEYATKLANGYKVTLTGFYQYFEKNQQHEVVNATIESFEAVEAEKNTLSGVVVAVNATGFLLKADDGYKYFYDKDITPEVVVGDVIEAVAEKTEYSGLIEYENYTLTKKGTQTVTHPEPTALSGTDFDSFTTQFGYASFRGKLSVSGNYYNVKIDGATTTGSLAGPTLPADVKSGQMIDVTGYYLNQTGSSTKYQNYIVTSIKLSDDQTGAGEPDEPATPADPTVLEPKEGEVCHALTLDEIQKGINVGNSGYQTLTISGAEGDWTANCNSKQAYLQFRNNNASYLTSPTYATEVKRVVLVTNAAKFKQTNEKTLRLAAVPVVNPATLPTGKDSNDKNINYTEAQWSTNYGISSVKSNGGAQNAEIKFSQTGVKQFSILSCDGAMYLDAIYVFCAK